MRRRYDIEIGQGAWLGVMSLRAESDMEAARLAMLYVSRDAPCRNRRRRYGDFARISIFAGKSDGSLGIWRHWRRGRTGQNAGTRLERMDPYCWGGAGLDESDSPIVKMSYRIGSEAA